MATFIRGQAVLTREPFVTVENRLDPGRHRFRVVVVDAAGRESAPTLVTIEIARGRTDRGAGAPERKVPRKKTVRKAAKKTASGSTTKKTGSKTGKKARSTTTKKARKVTKKTAGKASRKKAKRPSSGNGGDGQ